MRGLKRSRGITPVIATIILSAVVIAVGGAVWSYSQGAATAIANDYIDGTMSLVNEVIERYTIEHVSNNSARDILYVWIFNYGEVDIIIDLYANSTSSNNMTLGTPFTSGELVKIEISFEQIPLSSGDEVALKAHSRRQNNEYNTYFVP